MYKKVKVKIVILHKSLLKLSSWWFFLFYQEFSTKLKKNDDSWINYKGNAVTNKYNRLLAKLIW